MNSPSHTAAIALAQKARQAGKTVVLVTGVFDVLHDQHKNFLLAAKKEGDVLLIGLESDVRVREMKGADRPVNPQQVRQQNVDAWHIADAVFILPEVFELEQRKALIEELRPHVLAVSSHTAHLEKKAAIMEEFGGTLKVVYEHRPETSSTHLIEKSKKQ
jgi:glycerol-3-phosphate cytidylyltransferase